MRRLLRWLLDVPDDLGETWRAPLRHRVEELEDNQARLERRFRRLQGELTGGVRRYSEDDDGEDYETDEGDDH